MVDVRAVDVCVVGVRVVRLRVPGTPQRHKEIGGGRIVCTCWVCSCPEERRGTVEEQIVARE